MGPALARRCLLCLGAAGGGRRIVVEASDGNRFAAFSASTEIVDAPGVVILPNVRGLHPFYEELVLRFGDAGVHVLALDYYGRQGPGAAEATSTTSRTSNKRPMTTSVATWRPPWPT
jgi:dienelactone hydrolase